METIYYIIKDGQQVGPMTVEELLRNGLNLGSIVWHPGLPDWTRAGNVPELAALLQEPVQPGPQAAPQQGPQQAPPPGYQTGYQQPYGQPYGQPQNPGYQQPYAPHNPQTYRRSQWMTAAIIATVIGFLFSCIGGILGVVGIIQASNANSAFDRGDYNEGERLDANAKTWTIISYVVTGLGFLACIAFFFIGTLGAL